jgi:hypothetical protein
VEWMVAIGPKVDSYSAAKTSLLTAGDEGSLEARDRRHPSDTQRAGGGAVHNITWMHSVFSDPDVPTQRTLNSRSK